MMQLLEPALVIDPLSSDDANRTLASFLALASQILIHAPHVKAIENSADVNRYFYHGAPHLDECQLIQPHERAAAVAWRLERYYADAADTVYRWPVTKPLRLFWSRSGSLFVVRGGAFFVGSREMARMAPFRGDLADQLETAIRHNGGRTLIHPITVGEPSAHELLALDATIQRDLPGLSDAVVLINNKKT